MLSLELYLYKLGAAFHLALENDAIAKNVVMDTIACFEELSTRLLFLFVLLASIVSCSCTSCATVSVQTTPPCGVRTGAWRW